MRNIKDLLALVGLGFVLCVLIGAVTPGINFRACLGPSEKCRFAYEGGSDGN